MKTLRQLMTREPVTVAPDATLREAVDLLARCGVSALPVTEGTHVVGLLSTQAIVAFEASTPGVPTERDVSDVWEEPPSVEADDLLPAEYFADLWDDAGLDVVERLRATESPEWDFLAEHTVEEAMVTDPPLLRSSASVLAATKLMQRTGSHGVLVVDDGRLCGIFTTMDVTRLANQGTSDRQVVLR